MGEADAEAFFIQKPRHHEAVATIVAGAAQDGNRTGLEPGGDGLGDGAAGIFHQGQRRNTAGYGHRISGRHLGGGEKLMRHAAPECGWDRKAARKLWTVVLLNGGYPPPPCARGKALDKGGWRRWGGSRSWRQYNPAARRVDKKDVGFPLSRE